MPKTNAEHWRWKAAAPSSGDGPVLVYEPGNWGDVLKGVWAVITARQLIRARGRRLVRYADPFAGSRVYPLTEAARRRLESTPIPWFRDLQAPFASRDKLASTASLIREAIIQEPPSTKLQYQIYDADPSRRESWKDLAETEVLEAASAQEALEHMTEGESRADFLLVDPYDLFDHWGKILPNALRNTEKSVTLLYLYNKSPRGDGHLRSYRTFRQSLDRAARPAGRVVLGRIPSDASLPRAYHEVILAGPESILTTVVEELATATHTLSRAITEAVAFERLK